jgi:hypothetical protein
MLLKSINRGGKTNKTYLFQMQVQIYRVKYIYVGFGRQYPGNDIQEIPCCCFTQETQFPG